VRRHPQDALNAGLYRAAGSTPSGHAASSGSKDRASAPPALARLFVALWPDAGTRTRLAAQAQAWHWPETARLEPPERLHLTLHFIGAQPRARVRELARGLARLPWAEADLALDQAAVWAGGVAVLQASVLPAALADLYAAIGRWLASEAIAPERRTWRPHVTLARKAAEASAATDGLPLHWRTAAPVLVESWRGYRVIA
jgi:2'-5' RNA ligase